MCRQCRRLARIIFGISNLFFRCMVCPCPSLNLSLTTPPPRSSPPLVAPVARLTIGRMVAVSLRRGSSLTGLRSSPVAHGRNRTRHRSQPIPAGQPVAGSGSRRAAGIGARIYAFCESSSASDLYGIRTRRLKFDPIFFRHLLLAARCHGQR